MTIEYLLHVEHDLRDQNARVDKHIASLHGRLEKLREKQSTLERTQRKVGAARDYEVRQRLAREKDLERAHAELEARKGQVVHLSGEAEKLRERIRELSQTVLNLNQEKHRLEAEYAHPSLQEAILHDAQRAGPVTEHVTNKTLEVLIPELRTGLQEAGHARHLLQHGPPIANLFTSFIVYIIAVFMLWIGYRSTRAVMRRLTLGRVLFSIDMAFAVIWLLVCFCCVIILADPLEGVTSHQKALSLIIQLILMAGMVINVILRCILLSGCLSGPSAIELILVIFIAQHYYQAVWVPILFDQPVTVNFMTYATYMCLNGGLAVHRARVMDQPIEKICTQFVEVEGTVKRSEWLRSKMERMFQYCEKLLTSAAVEYDDEESVRQGQTSSKTGVRGILKPTSWNTILKRH